MTPSESILEEAKKMRTGDWIKWAGNRHSKEEWEELNIISIENQDYLTRALFKYLDEHVNKTV